MGLSRFSDPEHAELLASPSWSRCEGLIRDFEDAWRRGREPALADYLQAEGAQRRALLVELAHADLEFRLRRGEPARVESYLASFPELAADRNAVVGLLAADGRCAGAWVLGHDELRPLEATALPAAA
jgi:hypothetical protein